MTGNQSFFTELEKCTSGHVTFGDGARGRIIAKENIDKSNLPCLNEVRNVDGLKANLISISQLCDQGYSVNFNNTGCVVTDKNNQVKLWHISLRSLDKVIRNEAIVGIPSSDINGKFFCGDCRVGKQTKSSYKSLKECYTIRVLELLHLDPMGLMQTESLGGKNLCLNLQREKGQKIIRIRSDHGKEFDNEDLNNFCLPEGIHHEFTAPITPQQNGVVERKNRTLQETARAMIHAKTLPLNFWAEAVNTACHIHTGTCYILADREYHRKWDVKSDKGIFLGYSQNSRAYRVFNIKLGTVMETINVVVNDFESNVNQFNIEDDETSVMYDVIATLLQKMPKDDSQPDSTKTNLEKITDEAMNDETVLVPSAHVKKNHPLSFIIGDPSAGITTRMKEKVDYTKMIADLCYVSAIEPTSVEKALEDEYWINNKTDESGNVTKNKARLVAQGYAQVEGVDFDEIFAPVASLEAIHLLLSIFCFRKFKLYQMDVKSAFLNEYLNEEVYVAQPKWFVDSEFPQSNKKVKVYLYRKRIDHKLYRSMIESLLYLTASRPDIAYAVGICARYQSDPRISHLNAVKRIIKYVYSTTDFGILYFYDTSSELVGYCGADWAGSADDRKSTSGGCFFLGNNLVSWFSKKQNCVPLSTAKAEYIAAGNSTMVNTRKGTYADKSSEEVIEAPSSRVVVHDIPRDSTKSIHEEIDSENVMKDIETVPTASEAHLSDMDSDNLDEVPLTRLLKKVVALHVVSEKSAGLALSVHSQKSSSSEGVFIPTPGLCQTSPVEPGPSHYSSPIQSPIPDSTVSTDPHAASVDASGVPEGGTDAQCEKSPVDNEDDVKPVDTDNHNDEVPVADTINQSAQ
ncbi:gag-pol polyprotein [Cucumis melo var. makuwa]|uniref:Gag-pol polyprotein n=1 Tax=Cucumis melo var. makuwa TaxID=1194695 RepID=A0A5A7UDQ0_CUCMM|nr:gag-pol polyprotein [Cucumis melo var. makuwa]